MESKSWFKLVGSAVLVSIACLDPGNLLGDIQIAQEMHYKAIWVIFISHILLYFIQEAAFSVSCISENDLAQLIRLNYTTPLKIFIWLSSEVAIICADLQEILGSVIALYLLTGIPFTIGIPIIIVIVFLILFIQEVGQTLFEIIFMFMVFILGICSYMNFILSSPRIDDILNGFIPNIPQTWKFTAVIGSIIMPQNIFLHSSLVQTRSHIKTEKKYFLKVFKIETAIILIISFLINMSIVGIFADKKYEGQNITLQNAGTYLKEFLKSISQTLWALGLLSSGIASTTTGALTGQYIMNGIFNFRVSRIKRAIITRSITLIPCYLIITAVDLDSVLNLLNVLQLVQLPFVVIPLLKFIMSKKIMHNHYFSKIKFGILIVLSCFLQIINYYSIIASFNGLTVGYQIAGWIFLIIYTIFCVYLGLVDIKEQCKNFNRIEKEYLIDVKQEDTKISNLLNLDEDS